jgi:hypothetical protein
MALRFQGEEIRTDVDVQDLLTKIRQDPRTSNPRVLTINQIAQMKAKNGGYPLDMHHDMLSPVQVHSEKEELALSQRGFRREYKHRDYPKYMFRRNAHPKFQKSAEERARIHSLTAEAQRIEMATVNEGDYIEEKIVNAPEEEAKLLKEKPNRTAGTGPWVRSVTEIAPFEEPTGEDPAVTIARLEGELAGFRDKKSA